VEVPTLGWIVLNSPPVILNMNEYARLICGVALCSLGAIRNADDSLTSFSVVSIRKADEKLIDAEFFGRSISQSLEIIEKGSTVIPWSLCFFVLRFSTEAIRTIGTFPLQRATKTKGREHP
jgi:hypothetical protein